MRTCRYDDLKRNESEINASKIGIFFKCLQLFKKHFCPCGKKQKQYNILDLGIKQPNVLNLPTISGNVLLSDVLHEKKL